jgi:cell division transport system permease protein
VIVTLVVIGLNISLHREEIEIMKLVGATKWYIRTPFLLEGIFYGFTSAILAVVTIGVFYPFLLPILERSFSPVKLFPNGPLVFLYLLIGEMFVGFLIGTIGAWFATRKYLEV